MEIKWTQASVRTQYLLVLPKIMQLVPDDGLIGIH